MFHRKINLMLKTKNIILLLALVAPAHGFGSVKLVGSDIRPTMTRPTAVLLRALIYGWDGEDEMADTTTATTNTPYYDFASDLGESCTPEGTLVAESLSYDQERAGHLARLAVAFSPPERALTLSEIEHVDVLCVYDNRIDIQAVLCETQGCVSLSVPVHFPVSCYYNDPTNQLESCVLRNLDELDTEAGSLLMVGEQQAAVDARLGELDDLCELNEQSFEIFPHWWLPPHCYPHLSHEFNNIRALLNEDEFQLDVVALAQGALKRIPETEVYKVLQAKVAVVGPAGMCFKARVESEHEYGRPIRILEVAHPFDQTMYDAESLRAAVLGAVAAADGK